MINNICAIKYGEIYAERIEYDPIFEFKHEKRNTNLVYIIHNIVLIKLAWFCYNNNLPFKFYYGSQLILSSYMSYSILDKKLSNLSRKLYNDKLSKEILDKYDEYMGYGMKFFNRYVSEVMKYTLT